MNRLINVFCLLAVAAMLTATASAASNQYWIADGTSGYTQDFGDGVNWASDTSAPLADGDTLHINSGNDATCPIISDGTNGLYPYPMNDILIGEDYSGSIGAGLLKQTSGTQDLYYALRIGNGAIADNPVSKFIMTGGTLHKMSGGGDPTVGANGGYGELDIGAGATVNFDYNWVRIGQDAGSQGKLDMTGGTMTVGEALRVGTDGGEGILSMTNGSTITINQHLRMGVSTSVSATATLSGASTSMVVNNLADESQLGQGGHLNLNIYDGATLDIGQGDGGTVSDKNVNIGSYGGSITLKMTEGSKFLIRTSNEVRLGNEGSATVTMAGSSNFEVFNGELNAGRNGGGTVGIGLNLTMNDHATFNSHKFTRFNCDGAVGDVILGTLDAEDEDATITLSDRGDFGCWGGKATLKMYAQTKLNVSNISDGGALQLGCGNDGYAIVELYNGAGISVTGVDNQLKLAADGDNAYCKLTMLGKSTVHSDDSIYMAGSYSSVTSAEVILGTITGDDTATMSTNGWFNVAGTGGTCTLTLNADTTFSANRGSVGASNGTGHVYINDTAHLTAADYIAIGDGNGSNADVTMTGGTMSATNWIAVSNNGGGNGELLMSGTSHATTADLQISFGGTGVVTVGNGTAGDTALLQAGTIELGYEYANDSHVAPDADATLNLKVGGTVETQSIRSATANAGVAPVSSIVNFDGGILKATAGSDSFIANTALSTSFKLNILSHGAKIDTNGFANTIPEKLTGSTGDGGLEVMNSSTAPGVLTLTGEIAYNGPTVIDAKATLEIKNGLNTTLSTVSGPGSLVVGNSPTSSTTLTVSSIRVGSLSLGGAASASAAAVPEPGTLALLVIALTALAGGLWSKRTR